MHKESHKQSSFAEVNSNSSKKFPIILICDEVNDAKNIGAIFRLADASGVQKVFFVSDKLPKKFIKIDKVARSTRHIIPHLFCSKTEVLKNLNSDVNIVAIETTDKSIPYNDFLPEGTTALILGSEVNGVSEFFLKECHEAIHIPMHGLNSSMNVAMAGAIVIYDLISKL